LGKGKTFIFLAFQLHWKGIWLYNSSEAFANCFAWV